MKRKGKWWSCFYKRIACLFSKGKFLERSHLPAAAIPAPGLTSLHCLSPPTSFRSLHTSDRHILILAPTLLSWDGSQKRAGKFFMVTTKESWPSIGWKEKAGLTLNEKILITRNPKSQFHVNHKTNMGHLKSIVSHESSQ